MNRSSAAQFNIQMGDELTWNVMPLLHEIKHALQKLIANGETSIIDLRSIPLAPGEESKILHTLGRGEIQLEFDALGKTEIIETRYAGVWLVTHYNEDAEIISRFIEITTVPDILRSQQQDIVAACERLNKNLQDNLLKNN
jgi:hydrogenase-1 operon protein HyaF